MTRRELFERLSEILDDLSDAMLLLAEATVPPYIEADIEEAEELLRRAVDDLGFLLLVEGGADEHVD